MKKIEVKVDIRNTNEFSMNVEKINKQLTRYHYPTLICKELEREIKKSKGWIKYEILSEFDKTNLMDVDVNFEGIVELMQVGNDDSKLFSLGNDKIGNILFNEHCTCDKCKKAIARGKYFVFSKTDDVKTRDDLIVLGSSCAKGYFPFNIEGFFRGLDNYIEELVEWDEDSLGERSMGANNIDLYRIANAVDIVTNGITKPYEKGVTLEDISIVYHLLTNARTDKDKKLLNRYLSQQTERLDLQEMIATARDYYERHNRDNDFCFNCNQFLQFDNINRKFLGRVASALIFGNLNARKEKEHIEEVKVSNYIMEEKEKFTNLELNFDKVISFETQYGDTSMMRFLDNEGNALIWYTKKSTESISPSARPLKKGDKVYLNGTCKGHKEYRGEKQTLITRCKSAVEPKFVPTAEEIEAMKQCEKDTDSMYDFFSTMNGF